MERGLRRLLQCSSLMFFCCLSSSSLSLHTPQNAGLLGSQGSVPVAAAGVLRSGVKGLEKMPRMNS